MILLANILGGCGGWDPKIVPSVTESSQFISDSNIGLYANGTTTCATSNQVTYCAGTTPSGLIGRRKNDPMDGKYNVLPQPIPDLNNLTHLAVGVFHSCSVITNKLYCWGLNHVGQLGANRKMDSESPLLVELSNIKKVAVGTFHTCAINIQREVFCWGYNEYGQLGNGTVRNSSVPTKVLGISNAKKISAGADHSCALTYEDKLFCWGWNASGQIGVNTFHPYYTTPIPVLDEAIHSFADVTTGSYHTCAISNNKQAFCWGQNGLTAPSPKISISNMSNPDRRISIKSIEISQNIVKLYFNSTFHNLEYCATSKSLTLCRKMDGDGVVTFGLLDLEFDETYTMKVNTTLDQMGKSNRFPEVTITLIDSEFNNINRGQSILLNFKDGLVELKWPHIGGGAYYYAHYKFSPESLTGSNNAYSLRRVIGKNSISLPLNASSNELSVYIEGAYLGGEDGQLGNGGLYNSRKPILVDSLTSVQEISANYTDTCALDEMNNLYCWGRTYKSKLPKLVQKNVMTFAMGGDHLCFRSLADKSPVYCSGGNYYGQLGDGTQVDAIAFEKFMIPQK